jgi:type I restriction enzyme S subunit
MDFAKPKLPEQIAIAKVLSDIDELIEGIVAETHKKRNILKGFQQSLISGDHFRENNISFEIKLIQNLPIEIKRGQLITGTTKVDGNIPVISGGISAAYFNNIANRFGTTITISASGANAGFVNLWRSDIWASDCSTIGESELYEVLYIFYVLKEKQKELFDAQYGGGQPHIRPKEIGEISIPWISKANQEDLVVILEGMSKEIELLETELAKYECIKQGLAHDLLTGNVRLA